VLSEQVAALREALADEKQLRAALQDEFGRLRAELAQAPRNGTQGAGSGAGQWPAPTPGPETTRRSRRPPAPPPSIRSCLIAAGFSSSDVGAVPRGASPEIELERLYLRDQAQQRGLARLAEFRAMESSRIEQELRRLAR